MLRLILLAVLGLVTTFATVAAATEVYSRVQPPRGRMIDIGGGRQLRLVCEGPKSERPVVWLESGAFSGAADWAAIQQKLTAQGLRSCAYDRAGMGYSDVGPKPRDGNAIVGDLEKLIAASGEAGPFVMTGHSMAGLYVRQYAARNPGQVVGVVLVDAVTPEMIGLAGAQSFVDRMTRFSRMASITASMGLTKPLYFWGDRIGLPPQGKAEKRRGFISARQSRSAYAEVLSWKAAAEQTVAAGTFDPAWPVAVITAGPPSPQMDMWNIVRQAPAQAARRHLIDNIDEASHTTMLGLKYGDRIVAGIDFVLKAAKR
ncbi:MAG: alpha/beta hydrolase [Pseudomonadota bacterium]